MDKNSVRKSNTLGILANIMFVLAVISLFFSARIIRSSFGGHADMTLLSYALMEMMLFVLSVALAFSGAIIETVALCFAGCRKSGYTWTALVSAAAYGIATAVYVHNYFI
jgi:hypothetical protein